jgi:hypothetical protein
LAVSSIRVLEAFERKIREEEKKKIDLHAREPNRETVKTDEAHDRRD